MAVRTNASSHTGDLYELCSRREIPSDDACFAAFIGRFMIIIFLRSLEVTCDFGMDLNLPHAGKCRSISCRCFL